MPRPKARNSAETICGSSNDESEKYFSPKIDGQIEREASRLRLIVSKSVFRYSHVRDSE